jgi:hypothetical protein
VVTPLGMTPGPDGAIWFANQGNSTIGRISTADSVTTSPAQGPAETAVSITGTGFSAGETVKVKYDTGQSAPTTMPLCTAIAAGDGTFTCAATIPPNAGAAGTHTIKASGKTSGTVAETLFLRTT